MRPLTITLPPETFQQILCRDKRTVSTKRNPRKDRYFLAKSPDTAKINGRLDPIRRVQETPDEWIIHI
jgi:hypothetical protein